MIYIFVILISLTFIISGCEGIKGGKIGKEIVDVKGDFDNELQDINLNKIPSVQKLSDKEYIINSVLNQDFKEKSVGNFRLDYFNEIININDNNVPLRDEPREPDRAMIRCGDTITRDTTLASDIICDYDDLDSSEVIWEIAEGMGGYVYPALQIIGDDILFDCNNHKIKGLQILGFWRNEERWSLKGTTGIFARGNNIEIKNCNVLNFSQGLWLSRVNNSIIHNNNLNQNVGGIKLRGLHNNLYENNIIHDNIPVPLLGPDGWFHVLLDSIVTNEGDVIFLPGYSGIIIHHSKDNILLDNNIDSSLKNATFGIFCWGSNEISILENEIINNLGIITPISYMGGVGIDIWGCGELTIQDNEIENTQYLEGSIYGYGIHSRFLRNSIIESNNIKYNSNDICLNTENDISCWERIPEESNNEFNGNKCDNINCHLDVECNPCRVGGGEPARILD